MFNDDSCRACGGVMQAPHGYVRACGTCHYMVSNLGSGAGTGVPGLEKLRRANFEILLDHIETVRRLSGCRLLEVGSARGWFLEAAQRRGATVAGIEPEAANAVVARGNGFAVEIGFFPSDLQDQGPFDMIVFNDVFEHLPDPSRTAKEIEDRLAPGGLLVINLPSSRGVLFRTASLAATLGMTGTYDRMWQKGFPSPHVSYFDPRNLQLMIERHSGLRQVSAFALPSVTRDGLGDRIQASHTSWSGRAMHAALWVMSFLLPVLPSDITVGVFQKPN